MQEISQDIFIETLYTGTTLGAINAPHGLILIDAPLKLDDTRLWRSTLLNLDGNSPLFLSTWMLTRIVPLASDPWNAL